MDMARESTANGLCQMSGAFRYFVPRAHVEDRGK